METVQFNLGVSDMMIFINACYRASEIKKENLKNFILILSCYASFIGEENKLHYVKSNESITKGQWSKIESISSENDLIIIPVQVNSKVRDIVKVKNNIAAIAFFDPGSWRDILSS